MDVWIQQLLMSDAPATAAVFLVIGVLVYVVDYKQFDKKPNYQREAQFSRFAAHTFVWGSLTVLVGLRVLNWLS